MNKHNRGEHEKMGKHMGRDREGSKKMKEGGNVAKNYAHSAYNGEMKKSTTGDNRSFPELDRVLCHDNEPISHISTVRAMHGKSPVNMDVMAKGGHAKHKHHEEKHKHHEEKHKHHEEKKMKMGGYKKMAAGGVGKIRHEAYD